MISTAGNYGAVIAASAYTSALIFTLMLHPRGMRSLEFANYANIMDIKNSLQSDQLKEIWNTDYKNL